MFRGRFRLREDRRFPRPAHILGPLEQRVLDWLWSRKAPAPVRELLPDFPATAYTTVMTTLDRLHQKGLLERTKIKRAFHYRPRCSREDLASEIARQSIERLLHADGGALRPILSTFVDTVSERDHDALDELEQLIRARRRVTQRGTETGS